MFLPEDTMPADSETRAIAPMPDQATDPWIYRIAMGALALALLLGVLGAVYLAGIDKTLPDGILAVVAGCGGALGGALVVKSS